MKNFAKFEIFGELNFFVNKNKRNILFEHSFDDNPSIKDTIESIGIPHVEIGAIVVNGELKNFNYKLENNDHVLIYSFYENINSFENVLRPSIKKYDFMTDENVGGMAKYLRMLGFNTIMIPEISDKEVAKITEKENRILLSRDIGLLKRKNVTYGLFLRSTNTEEQLFEVIKKFDLNKYFKPFSICIECNGNINTIDPSKIIKEDRIKEGVLKDYQEFFRCDSCKKIFWKGSHYQKMETMIQKYLR